MTNPFQRRPNQDGRHTPNLWPVWLVAPGALLLVALAAYGLYHGAELLLADESTGQGKKPVPVQDVIKTTVTVLTLAGAVLAALYAYRKQLLDEGTSHRADATQLTERYTKAAEQLGHEQAAVRLAGVYAMARLADDWPEQRKVCVDVLCAYLRMPYTTVTTASGFRHGEREVRLTIIRIIRSHLQNPFGATTWCEYSLDFTGATFDGCDFNGSYFRGDLVDFSDALFIGGKVNFRGVTFSGRHVDFSDARFSARHVDFGDARFSASHVDFTAAKFSESEVVFSTAKFSASQVSFIGASFSEGLVYFNSARFEGGGVGFIGARFSASQVYFRSARFEGGGVGFRGAVFSDGLVSFTDAVFSAGSIDFGDMTFSDCPVSFENAAVEGAATIGWGSFPPIPGNHP
ncbi:pentapeptide repeat-containing protein [Streptomyces cyaneofuscatus]|uniref:pentapeptide repeat-containing protein n=1 Tax=Streptomyces cyaneofuscatus TaxID=66883 RepID=UPI00339F59B3